MRRRRGKRLNSKSESRISLENFSKQEGSEAQGTSNTLHHLHLTISDDDDLPLINFGLDSKSRPIKDNLCSICSCDFQYYVDQNWICSMCNKLPFAIMNVCDLKVVTKAQLLILR